MFIFIHLGKERNAARRKKNKNILQPPGPPGTTNSHYYLVDKLLTYMLVTQM